MWDGSPDPSVRICRPMRPTGPTISDGSGDPSQAPSYGGNAMAVQRATRKSVQGNSHPAGESVSREQLIDLLNDHLRREYQAIISYVTYSQVLKGAAYMNIAAELELHAAQELAHALIVAKQIDYLGGDP